MSPVTSPRPTKSSRQFRKPASNEKLLRLVRETSNDNEEFKFTPFEKGLKDLIPLTVSSQTMMTCIARSSAVRSPWHDTLSSPRTSELTEHSQDMHPPASTHKTRLNPSDPSHTCQTCQTHTREVGHGFGRVWVRVSKIYPWVTRGVHYSLGLRDDQYGNQVDMDDLTALSVYRGGLVGFALKDRGQSDSS
jgi:hypothetical protein